MEKGETAARCERASEILSVGAILCALLFHLVPALFAGFLAHMLLRGMARRLRGGRVSHGVARALAVSLLGLAAAGIVAAAALLLHGFVRGRLGDLPGLLASVGETVRRLLSSVEALGIPVPAPTGNDGWLSRYAVELRHAGLIGLRGLAHVIVGAILGVLVFFGAPEKVEAPLGAALAERITRFDAAFRTVAKAQLEISAVNTSLTGLYLLVALPLFGIRVPLAGTLVALTFVCGLLPVIGNLVSNAFGVPGLVLAPVVYAWTKAELVERGLV